MLVIFNFLMWGGYMDVFASDKFILLYDLHSLGVFCFNKRYAKNRTGTLPQKVGNYTICNNTDRS